MSNKQLAVSSKQDIIQRGTYLITSLSLLEADGKKPVDSLASSEGNSK